MKVLDLKFPAQRNSSCPLEGIFLVISIESVWTFPSALARVLGSSISITVFSSLKR